MHVAARIGIAATTTAAAGFGAYKLNEFVSDKTQRDHAQIDREVGAAAKSWDTWNAALEREFPGRKLDTPADHARFEEFLKANPEPSWVSVDHQDYTRVRLGIDEPIIDSDLFPVEREKGIGYMVMAAGMGVVGGVALLNAGLRGSSGSTLATFGKIAGGGVALAYGAGIGAALVNDVRTGTNLDGYADLRARVHADMQ